MMKYCAETRDHDRQSLIISTSYITVIFLTIISVIIYCIFSNQFATLFSINPEIFGLSIIFAVLLVFYNLTTATIRGLHRMKEFALFQPIFGFTLLISFLFFIVLLPPSFKAMVYANYLACAAIGCVIVIIFLKKYLTFKIDRLWLSTAWRYSNFALIGGLAFTLYSNVDRILINYYMDTVSLGIYGVYYFASFAAIALISGIFINVFFPTVSKITDKILVYGKLKKMMLYLFILGVPGSLISEYIIMQLFGREYPIDFPLMVIFAVSAVLVTWYTIIAWFFYSDGLNGIRMTVSGTVLITITNIVLNIVFIPRIGLYGAIGASVIAP